MSTINDSVVEVDPGANQGSFIREKNKMTTQEKHELPPIEKYRKYGKFPWKLVFHFLLALATSIQCLIMIRSTFSHTRAEIRYFYYWFMDPDGSYNEVDYDMNRYIFDIGELRDLISDSRDNYYGVEDNSIEGFNNIRDSNEKIVPIEGQLLFLTEAPTDDKYPMHFKITEDDLAYFDSEKYNNTVFRELINKCREIQLTYILQSVVEQPDYCSVDCFEWEITQRISLEHFSHAIVDIKVDQRSCDSSEKYEWARHLWIHLLVFVLAAVSAYLSWKYLFDIMYITKREKVEKKEDKPINDVPAAFALMTIKNEKYIQNLRKSPYKRRNRASIKVKPELTSFAENFKKVISSKSTYTINKWNIACLVGNILQLGGVCIYLFDLNQRLTVTNVFFGVGCFLAWLNIGRYLEYSKQYFIVFHTLFTSLPTTARFLAANIPVFLGYAFLGTCVFWQSYRFQSVSKSMMTEFALFLGDSVFDIFIELTAINFWMGQLYLYTFLLMFFAIVQNFFISIIQYSYFSIEDLELKRAKLHRTFQAQEKPETKKAYKSKEEELESIKKEVRENNVKWAKRIEQLESEIEATKKQ